MPADLPTLRAQVEEARRALEVALADYAAAVALSHPAAVANATLQRSINAHAAAVRRLAIVECGQPFGFTREDVTNLREVRSWCSSQGDIDSPYMETWARTLADRIESLLPPEGKISDIEKLRASYMHLRREFARAIGDFGALVSLGAPVTAENAQVVAKSLDGLLDAARRVARAEDLCAPGLCQCCDATRDRLEAEA